MQIFAKSVELKQQTGKGSRERKKEKKVVYLDTEIDNLIGQTQGPEHVRQVGSGNCTQSVKSKRFAGDFGNYSRPFNLQVDGIVLESHRQVLVDYPI